MTPEKLPESVLEAIGAYGSAAEKYPDPGERAALEKLKAAILAALYAARAEALEEAATRCENERMPLSGPYASWNAALDHVTDKIRALKAPPC